VNGLKKLLGADDALDVFGVHAVGGILGALLTGVFNSPTLGGPSFPVDWFTGKITTAAEYSIWGQFLIQAKAVGVVFVWTAVVAFISFKIADLLVGLRVTRKRNARAWTSTRTARPPIACSSGRSPETGSLSNGHLRVPVFLPRQFMREYAPFAGARLRFAPHFLRSCEDLSP